MKNKFLKIQLGDWLTFSDGSRALYIVELVYDLESCVDEHGRPDKIVYTRDVTGVLYEYSASDMSQGDYGVVNIGNNIVDDLVNL